MGGVFRTYCFHRRLGLYVALEFTHLPFIFERRHVHTYLDYLSIPPQINPQKKIGLEDVLFLIDSIWDEGVSKILHHCLHREVKGS